MGDLLTLQICDMQFNTQICHTAASYFSLVTVFPFVDPPHNLRVCTKLILAINWVIEFILFQ